MCESDRENRIINNRNCIECGSNIIEIGNTHYHCVICGIQLESLGYDTSYIFPSEIKGPRRTNKISDLGSQIEVKKNSPSFVRKLSIIQNRLSSNKISYADKIIIEAEVAGVSGLLLIQLTDIIDLANSTNKLTRNRDGMVGLKTLNDNKDKSQYRCRVYAAAALEILNRNLNATEVLMIVDSWNIEKNDLIKAIKFIKKILLSQGHDLLVNHHSYELDSHDVSRNRNLNFQLEQFTDHLAEIFGFYYARCIIDLAIEILADNGEPIGECNSSDIDGKFRNLTPQRAAMESIIDSMILSGFNNAAIQSFYAKVPVPGLKWINSRLGVYRRSLPENF